MRATNLSDKIWRSIFALHLVLIPEFCYCDNLITNGGFEGPDGIEVVPPEWTAGCGYMNTPDSQPGWYNNYLPPFEGKGYINLLYKSDGSEESVYQELQKTLPAGSCFLIDIKLAKFCQDSLFGLDPYGLNHPGRLVIRGSESFSCDDGQILAVFDAVENCLWKSYFSVFKAETDIRFIYLEFSSGSSGFFNGSIVLDDFKLEYTKPLPDQVIEVPYQDTATVSASFSGSNFNWDVDGIFVANGSAEQSVYADHNLHVDVSYITSDSCVVYESFDVLINPAFPNIFTPGTKDFINDEFYISGLVENCGLMVHNRWGQEVYSNSDYRNDWSPENLSDGLYFYQLWLKETNRYKTGSVYIF